MTNPRRPRPDRSDQTGRIRPTDPATVCTTAGCGLQRDHPGVHERPPTAEELRDRAAQLLAEANALDAREGP